MRKNKLCESVPHIQIQGINYELHKDLKAAAAVAGIPATKHIKPALMRAIDALPEKMKSYQSEIHCGDCHVYVQNVSERHKRELRNVASYIGVTPNTLAKVLLALNVTDKKAS